MSTQVDEEWISGTQAGKRLACVPRQLPKLAAKGLISVRRVPGCAPRYLLADVERLASQATQMAQNLALKANAAPAGEVSHGTA